MDAKAAPQGVVIASDFARKVPIDWPHGMSLANSRALEDSRNALEIVVAPDRFFSMRLDELPSVPVIDLRRSRALMLDMSRVAVTLQGDDDAPVSTQVGVVRVRIRSGATFLQFICGSCGRRAQVLRLYTGHIMCGRCTGLRYWCEGKPALRQALDLSVLRRRGSMATQFRAAPGERWSAAPSS